MGQEEGHGSEDRLLANSHIFISLLFIISSISISLLFLLDYVLQGFFLFFLIPGIFKILYACTLSPHVSLFSL